MNTVTEPTLHISGLPWDVNERDIRSFFRGYNITAIKIQE
jgi:hypothetical protein